MTGVTDSITTDMNSNNEIGGLQAGGAPLHLAYTQSGGRRKKRTKRKKTKRKKTKRKKTKRKISKRKYKKRFNRANKNKLYHRKNLSIFRKSLEERLRNS